MPIEHSSAIDKLIDYVPDLMQRAGNVINKVADTKMSIEKEEANKDKKENTKKETINKVITKKGPLEKTKIEIDYNEDGKNEQYLEDE